MFLRVNGLFGHVRQNDIRSVVSFLGFAIAIQLVAAAVLLIPLLFIDVLHSPLNPGAYLLRYGSAVMLITCGLFVWRYDRYCDDMEDAIGYGLMPVGSQRLRRAAEEMAITAGIPSPRVALIESSALNAFACGTKPENSVIVATRGLIDTLDDRELRAVVAHEITHIKNGDIRFMASAHVLFGILELFGKLNKFQLKKRKRNWFAVLVPALYILPAMASLGAGLAFMLGRAMRSGVSLSREFIADAEAVRLNQDAGALVSALRKVEGRSRVDGLRPEFEAMMIDGAAKGRDPTHPPIAERIAALIRLAGPSAAETYVSAPVMPSQRGFGRRQTVSAFMAAPSPAFAGLGTGGMTAEEDFIRNSFNTSTKTKSAKNVVIALVAFPFVSFASSLVTFCADHSERRTEQAQAKAVAETELARNTGCFVSQLQVSPERLRPVSLNPRLIEAYRQHRLPENDIAFENYVAEHRASLLDAQLTSAEGRDRSLIDYAAKRKLLLESSALFFGADGLRAMLNEYDTPGDAALIGEIKERLGTSPVFRDNPDATPAELANLTAHPEKFVPCRTPTVDSPA